MSSLLLLPSNHSFSIKTIYPGQHSPGFRPLVSDSSQSHQHQHQSSSSTSTPSSSSNPLINTRKLLSLTKQGSESSSTSDKTPLLSSEPSSPPPSYYNNNHLTDTQSRISSPSNHLDRLSLPHSTSTSDLYTIYSSPALKSSQISFESDSELHSEPTVGNPDSSSHFIDPFQDPSESEDQTETLTSPNEKVNFSASDLNTSSSTANRLRKNFQSGKSLLQSNKLFTQPSFPIRDNQLRFQRLENFSSSSTSKNTNTSFSKPTPPSILITSNHSALNMNHIAPHSPKSHSDSKAVDVKRSRSGTMGAVIGSSGNGRNNFRPMTYETKAQLDSFFVQTSKQKKEGRLRTKDEEGRRWYDGIGEFSWCFVFETSIGRYFKSVNLYFSFRSSISLFSLSAEKEEWRHLLSPTSPAGGFNSSRRSSSGTTSSSIGDDFSYHPYQRRRSSIATSPSGIQTRSFRSLSQSGGGGNLSFNPNSKPLSPLESGSNGFFPGAIGLGLGSGIDSWETNGNGDGCDFEMVDSTSSPLLSPGFGEKVMSSRALKAALNLQIEHHVVSQSQSQQSEKVKKVEIPMRRTRVKRSDSAVERCKEIGDSLPKPKSSKVVNSSIRSDPYQTSLIQKRRTSGEKALSSTRSRRCKTAEPELQLNPFGNQVEQVEMDWEASSEGDEPSVDLIRLPAYLPLPHRKANKDLLDSAFSSPANPFDTPSSVQDKSSFSQPDFASSTSSSKTIAGTSFERKRPAPLELRFETSTSILNKDPSQFSRSTSPSPTTILQKPMGARRGTTSNESPSSTRARRPFSMHEYSPSWSPSSASGMNTPIKVTWSPMTPISAMNAGGTLQDRIDEEKEIRNRRRGSSFDLGGFNRRRSSLLGLGSFQGLNFGSSSNSNNSSSNSISTSKDQNNAASKAKTVLGMEPGQGNLLVPSGLITGESVYEGVDIPCPSVHLASDDENDDEDESSSASKSTTDVSNSNGKSSKKSWLSRAATKGKKIGGSAGRKS